MVRIIDPNSPEEIAKCLRALKGSSDYSKSYAARSLAHVGKGRPDIIGALREALSDPDLEVRVEIARALAMLEPEEKKCVDILVDALHQEVMEVRVASASALEELGPFAREEKLSALSKHLRKTVPDLTTALHDANEYVREGAARALGKLGFAEAVPALIQHINDKDDDVQVEIIRALFRIGKAARRAIPALLAVLQGPNRPARETAAGTLASLAPENKEVLQALCQALQDPDDYFRWAVAREFALMGEAAAPALSYLIKALKDEKDEDTGVHAWIAEALEKLGPRAREAIPPLKEIMNGPSEYLRQLAENTLKAIEGSDNSEIGRESGKQDDVN